MASATSATPGIFTVNGIPVNLNVAKWYGFTGQYYDRRFDLNGYTVPDVKPLFLHHDNIAWVASHYHFGYPSANVPYTYCYLFRYEIDLPKNTTKATLPDNDRIKIFAVTTAKRDADDIKLLELLSDSAKMSRLF